MSVNAPQIGQDGLESRRGIPAKNDRVWLAFQIWMSFEIAQ